MKTYRQQCCGIVESTIAEGRRRGRDGKELLAVVLENGRPWSWQPSRYPFKVWRREVSFQLGLVRRSSAPDVDRPMPLFGE